MDKSKQLTNIKLLSLDSPTKSIQAVKRFDIKNLGKQKGTETFKDGLAKSHLYNRYESINKILRYSDRSKAKGRKYQAKHYFRLGKQLSKLTKSPWIHGDGQNHFQTPQRADANNLVYNTRKQFHLPHALRASWNIKSTNHKQLVHPWHVNHHVNLSSLAHLSFGKARHHISKAQLRSVKNHSISRK